MATSCDFRRAGFLAGSGAPRLTSSCMKSVLLLVLVLVLFSSWTTAQGIRNFPGFMSPDRIVVYDQTSRKFLVIDRTRTIQ